MYDTLGFPVDLTQLILKENNMHLDLWGFEDEMKIKRKGQGKMPQSILRTGLAYTIAIDRIYRL